MKENILLRAVRIRHQHAHTVKQANIHPQGPHHVRFVRLGHTPVVDPPRVLLVMLANTLILQDFLHAQVVKLEHTQALVVLNLVQHVILVIILQ